MAGFLCPADLASENAFAVPDAFGKAPAQAATTSHAACVGGDESDTSSAAGLGIFYRNSATRFGDILDGTSNTIMIGERAWANANGIWVRWPTRSSFAPLIIPAPAAAPRFTLPAFSCSARPSQQRRHRHRRRPRRFFQPAPAAPTSSSPTAPSVFCRSIPGDLPSGDYTPESVILQALLTRAKGEVVPVESSALSICFVERLGALATVLRGHVSGPHAWPRSTEAMAPESLTPNSKR